VSTLVGYYEGARVEIEWRDGQQVVSVSTPMSMEAWPARQYARALSEALGGSGWSSAPDRPGELCYEVVHDDAVDRRIVELVDLLVAIRYQHPRMMQLELALTPEEQEALDR
jgi:hypothetical protein